VSSWFRSNAILEVVGPDGQDIARGHLWQRRLEQLASPRDHLDQLGTVCPNLSVNARPKALEITLQAVKHTLDLELLGEPLSREARGVDHERGTHARAERTAGELFPQQGTMLGSVDVQRDLPVVESMIIGEPPQKQRMDELVDQIWKPLSLDDPLASTELRDFVCVGAPAQVLLPFTEENRPAHLGDRGCDPTDQIGGSVTLDECTRPRRWLVHFCHAFPRKLR
jgi:hypothetical protein